MNLNEYKNNLLFVPLGGSSEIGMNANLYQYKGKWIMIDLGIGFADKLQMPGVDIMVPDLDFIIKRRKDLLGIFVTHAHEDHYGGFPAWWEELRCPVYTTAFTADCLRAKLEPYGLHEMVPINVVNSGDTVEVGPFSVEFVNLTHSIPEMQSLIVRTEKGTVVHTGDWKIDDDPVVGSLCDKKRLEEIGNKEKVLAMVCDSTNVLAKGHSQSEGDLVESLTEIVAKCQKFVIVTLFASNVARVYTIAKAAMASGRKVVVMGRSLWRIIDVAMKNGYLPDVKFYTPQQATGIPRDKMVLLCTGCQGENRAALSRIAEDDVDEQFRLTEGDTVIFSSKIIPGNDLRIFGLFNKLALKNVNVISESNALVHVSGHPCQEELKYMYDIVKPVSAVPVHGEPIHILEHARQAKKWGVKCSVRPQNGSIVDIDVTESKVIGSVHSGYFGVDGNVLLDPNGEVISMRRSLFTAGIILIVVVLSSNEMQMMKAPFVIAPGALDRKLDSDIMDKIVREVEGVFMGGKRIRNVGAAAKAVKSSVRSICRTDIGKEPFIHVQVEIV